MRAVTPSEPLRIYTLERDTQHGYWHDYAIVYEGASFESVEALIAHCDEPGYYRDPEIAASERRRFERMQRDGVTHVFDTYRASWVRFTFQQYSDPASPSGKPAWCEGKVSLPSQPESIAAAAKLFKRIESRLRRLEPAYSRWHNFESCKRAIAKVCDAQVHAYEPRPGGRRDLVLRVDVPAQPLRLVASGLAEGGGR